MGKAVLMTPHGELPVVGVLHDCENTERGWQYRDDDGNLCEITSPPEWGGVARIPAVSYIIRKRDGVPTGVLLLQLKQP